MPAIIEFLLHLVILLVKQSIDLSFYAVFSKVSIFKFRKVSLALFNDGKYNESS